MSNELSDLLVAQSIHLMPPAGDGNREFGQDTLLWVAFACANDLTEDEPFGSYTAWGKGETPLAAALACVERKKEIERGVDL